MKHSALGLLSCNNQPSQMPPHAHKKASTWRLFYRYLTQWKILEIEVRNSQRIFFYKQTTRLNVIAHESGKHLISCYSIIDGHT